MGESSTGIDTVQRDSIMKHVLDISSYQPHVNWPNLRNSNPDLGAVYVKYGESISYVNEYAAAQVKGAKSVGFPVGLYYYVHPGVGSGKTQADRLLTGCRLLKPNLRPMLDLEWTESPIKGPALVLWVMDFCNRVKQILGVRPLLYTYPAYWNERVIAASGMNEKAVVYFETQPLWIAHYDTDIPTIPPPWRHYTLWQHTSKATRNGIIGFVDDSYLAGPVRELALPKLTYVLAPIRRIIHR